MHIINLVDSVEQINYGIWNAVISLFPDLEEQGCRPEIWFTSDSGIPDEFEGINWRSIPHAKSFTAELLKYSTDSTIVVSHGLWKQPTTWGNLVLGWGYVWVIVPHGMLEPWSMHHKWWKKLPYYHLVERRRIVRANRLIAVGLNEYHNLQERFPYKIHLLNNGIAPANSNHRERGQTYRFLFMSRLHHKKGVKQLLQGWLGSNADQCDAELIIAGPDEGEGLHLRKILKDSKHLVNSRSVKLVGPQYGPEKENLLKSSDFFILPSFSEGLPTAVLEAMSWGCLAIITEGCNFPEALEQKLTIRIEPTAASITESLNTCMKMSREEVDEVSARGKLYVDHRFDLKEVAKSYADFYHTLLMNS